MTCCENTCVLAWDGTSDHFSQALVTAKISFRLSTHTEKTAIQGLYRKNVFQRFLIKISKVFKETLNLFKEDCRLWVLKANLNLSAFPRVFHTFWSVWPLLEKLRASTESSLQQRILPTGKIHKGWEQSRGGHSKLQRGVNNCKKGQGNSRGQTWFTL